MDYKSFLAAELSAWDMAAENFSRIARSRDDGRLSVLTADDTSSAYGGWRMAKLHVDHRRASITAKTDSASIASRPCFLCRSNRPATQSSLECLDGRFEVLINPYPLASVHFTIASTRHDPQLLSGDGGVVSAMVALARDMEGLCVFYNGARCGASAPDHLHFQAVSTETVPNIMNPTAVGSVIFEADGVRLSRSRNGFAPYQFFVVESTDDVALSSVVSRLFAAMEVSGSESGFEPPVNVAMIKQSGSNVVRTWVIPRGKHRPDCYFGDDERKLLVSPATVEMLGMIVCSRAEDYARVDLPTAENILAEVAVSNSRYEDMIKNFITFAQ